MKTNTITEIPVIPLSSPQKCGAEKKTYWPKKNLVDNGSFSKRDSLVAIYGAGDIIVDEMAYLVGFLIWSLYSILVLGICTYMYTFYTPYVFGSA